MKQVLIIVVACVLGPGVAGAQDGVVFERVMRSADEGHWEDLPFGALMQRVGEQFLGAPYEAGLLDHGPDEHVVADLDRFDCVLYVESVLALARGVASGRTDHASFVRRIEEQRYRDGRLDGYCSRLHYFSEWIRDNERRGIVQNITGSLDGEPLPKQLNFMGTHRDSYALLTSDSLYSGILSMEDRLADLEIVYVPQERIRSVYDRLQPGDIVALATSVQGLDVSHTGLVYDAGDGARGLLHASLDRGVVVSPDLQFYVESHASQIGIIVARPVDPRNRDR